MKDITIFWFRRDLRLSDNHGLFHALNENPRVLGLFIFDITILESLESKSDPRVHFIHTAVHNLKVSAEKQGSSLIVHHGKPLEIFKQLLQSHTIRAVYCNRDYEPYARTRDRQISDYLSVHSIPFRSFKDQVIFEGNEILKENGQSYSVFTPYSKRWKALWEARKPTRFKTDSHFENLLKTERLPLVTLREIGFKPATSQPPSGEINKEIIKKYHLQRNTPSMPGTTRLGVHLRFGSTSIRKLAQIASELNPAFLNELIWREFYMMIMFHFPKVVTHSFKSQYDNIAWRNNQSEFERWCQGTTGYPIVDAGMRELNQTGFMHNRLRMITASFLTKHLLVDWRWGEAYFAQKLLDFELASNNGGWQWAAGSGCDAAPYFRVFNPYLQTKKFDKELKYVSKWVPEWNNPDYPSPIVEHSIARARAIETYRKGLRPD